MKLNVDAHLLCLGTYAERYVPRGYYDEMDADRQLEIMSKIEGRVENWRATNNFSTFPAPATSNPAFGFPELGFLVNFIKRLM